MKRGLSPNRRILCCITTKNSEKTVRQTLESLSRELLDILEEVLVIDNSSSDKTIQVAKDCLAEERFENVKVSIFQNSTNYGLGGSHKVAFKYALDCHYDFLLIVHGDNSSRPDQFLDILKGDFFKFDMVLSTRLSTQSIRKNYAAERLFFNRALSFLASIMCLRKIEDFSGGGINLYRVQSFINNYENPLKYFGNDVSFSQFLTLYAVYRRHKFFYVPIDLDEKDTKRFKRLSSQFIKSLLLLTKFRLFERKTIGEDIYGTYFGQNYRKIKIREEVADITMSAQVLPDVNRPTKEVRVERSNDNVKFKFTDLNRLSLKDKFSQSFEGIDLSVVESVEKDVSDYLAVEIELDVNNITGQGLRSLLLRLFKKYSPRRMVLLVKANENILKTKQCYEFFEFLNNFKVNFTIVSTNPCNQKLWQFYSGKANCLILSFEYGHIHRSEFFCLAKGLCDKNRTFINVQTSVDRFYYGYGLKEKLVKEKVGESVLMLPYGRHAEEMLPDHRELIDEQKDVNFNMDKLILKFTHTSQRSSLSSLLVSSANESMIRSLRIDCLGGLSIWRPEGNVQQFGNLFVESSIDLNAI